MKSDVDFLGGSLVVLFLALIIVFMIAISNFSKDVKEVTDPSNMAKAWYTVIH